MLVCCVVGARPNFMKMAPVVRALRQQGITPFLVHTGQHYDDNMSAVFFEELGLPRPDTCLEVGSDSHARQTGRVMVAFEEVCEREKPALVVVAGDVNSTLAAALVAAKLVIPVAHIEAGLRSHDRTMPEEVNRLLTDHLSSLLFTTEESGNENLQREGVAADRVHFVGNCMVDTLLAHLPAALSRDPWQRFGVQPGGYAVLTLHRPSNVDDPETLAGLVATIDEVSRHFPVVFPVHPRARGRLAEGGVAFAGSVLLCDPLPYLEFIGLLAKARVVLTDSGGIQEETTTLGVPCLTLRWNTERPVTITRGTNRLVGTDRARILEALAVLEQGRWQVGERPPLWDGNAGRRVAEVICRFMGGSS